MKTLCWMTSVARPKPLWCLMKASLLGSLLLLLVACKAEQMQLSGHTMGTTYHISYLQEADTKSKATIKKVITARLEAIEDSMSTYRKHSEISRFNQMPVGEILEVSKDFAAVFSMAKQVYQQSDKSFDPSIGPLVNLWGFGPKISVESFHNTPSIEAIAKAQKLLQFNKLKLNGLLLEKTAAVYLDFSAIAKGYGVDVIAQVLKEFGLKNFMVEIGGEVATSGHSSRGDAWRIGIELPAQFTSDISGTLLLTNTHVATSGDYRNYYEVDGVRYSHTIDPRDGKPVHHKLSSVTVIHDSVALADAFATALSVLGEIEGKALADKLGLKALFIFKTEQGFDGYATQAIKPYLQP